MSKTIDNGNPTPPVADGPWTPVRNGDVFCSPACGYGCTLEEYKRAAAGAAAIAAALGDGWKPNLHENMGWYFSASKGGATVRYNDGTGDFSAYIDTATFGGPVEQFRRSAATPREAVQLALDAMEQKIATLRRAVASASLEPLAMEAPALDDTVPLSSVP